MIKITDIKVPLEYDMNLLRNLAAQRLKIDSKSIENISIVKRNVDSNDKHDIHFTINVVVSVSTDENLLIPRTQKHNIKKGIFKAEEHIYNTPTGNKLNSRPVVVGFGPAGMFAALILAQAGVRPVILERGSDVDRRKKSVTEFWEEGMLDVNSNVQFGEGGAGTFSDGKLKVGEMNSRKMKILSEFVEGGAPPEIMYLSKPHIGTDKLSEAVKYIRNKIISLGGEVHFNAKVTEIYRKDNRVKGVVYIEKGVYKELYTDNVILAIGHSARDTFEYLYQSGIYLEQKPFAMGVRIEHTQEMINKIKYGDYANHPSLGAADYRMVVHLPNGRSVYTFCMCPGGYVVAATSEANRVVTNGMSEYNRDGVNANTALYVSIDKKDLKSEHPLAGIRLQESVEEAAFIAGGGGYKAPVQRLCDFLNKCNSTHFGDVLPTYKPGTDFSSVDSYLPNYICDSLRQGIAEMEEWMPGFAYPDAILTGAETRSSSPVRITRGDTLEAEGIMGLYPCGEGAGYAGGIISAALDGIKCAEQILK